MKIFHCKDLTEDKNNDSIYGKELVVKEPTKETMEAYQRTLDELDKIYDEEHKSSVPSWLWKMGLAVIGVGFIIILIFITEGKSLYAKVPWLLWVGIAFSSLLIFYFLDLFRSIKRHSSDEYDLLDDRADALERRMYAEMEIPTQSAKKIDVLSFSYKVKGKRLKLYKSKFLKKLCHPESLIAYREKNTLYLCDLTGRCAVPLSSVKSIKKIKKYFNMSTLNWNKEESPNSKKFYKSGLRIGRGDKIYFTKAYVLTADIDGEEWRIYFPCYELKALERLTGITVEE